MIPFLIWYLFITLLGLVTWPLVFRLLPALPDRGYAFSRVVGLLIWGYGFWLLGSLGVLENDLGGLLLTFGILLALGVWAARRSGPENLLRWAAGNRTLILSMEALFLAAFAGWTLVRSANPAIYATEKPMELAFINAILKSPRFPPNDPWLSGYAISYYYFGYVLTAMFARLSGLTGGVAFNLSISLVFGLAALGAYGVVFNLLAARSREVEPEPTVPGDSGPGAAARDRLGALMGPLFVLWMGNLGGVLAILHSRGLFWSRDSAGQWTSAFWRWLDIRAWTNPPSEPFSWLPDGFGTGAWWWWQASRVVQDYDLAGNWKEVIDEFPFFSFLLADLHPHVLAIPFAFLAMALALNLYLGDAQGELSLVRLFPALRRLDRKPENTEPLEGVPPSPRGLAIRISEIFSRLVHFRLFLPGSAFLFSALALGGLAFLNTWDFPMYVALYAGAYALVRARREGWSWARLGDFLGLSLALGLVGSLLYLPFFISFSSQAGGIIPNLVYPTRGAHLWVMFGLFFVPLFAYLVHLWRQQGDGARLRAAARVSAGLVLALFLLAFLLAGLLLALPALENPAQPAFGDLTFSGLRDLFLDSIGARGQVEALFPTALFRRLASAGTWLTLGALMTLTVGLLWSRRPESGQSSQEVSRPVTPFVLLLILLATLLVLGPESVFLRDQFGWRINTIFKFYYQAWLLWGVATAFGVVVLWRALTGLHKTALQVGLVLAVAAGLSYSTLSLWDKTQGFRPVDGLTLDGTLQGHYLGPDDIAAVNFLQSMPGGVIAEAVGGSYSQYARISAHTGLPTVLGWPGHESQWRGGAREMGTRERDIQNLYTTQLWTEVERVLDLYDVRYVYFGNLERSTYGSNDRLFQQHLNPVFWQGQVIIYEVPQG